VAGDGGTTRGLVMRRARVQAPVVLAALFLVFCATTALVTVAAFASDTQARAVAATARDATAAQRQIVVQTPGVPSGTALDGAARDDVTSTLTAIPSATTTGLLGAARAVPGTSLLPVLWSSPEAAASADLVSGQWPYMAGPNGRFDPADHPVPVAVSADEAARYHYTVGSRLPIGAGIATFDRPATEDIGVVVGIYKPKSATAAVWAVPAGAGAGTLPLLIDTGTFDNAREAAAGDVVVIELDLSRLTIANLSAAQTQIDRLGNVLTNDSSIGFGGAAITVSPDAARLLDGTARALAAARPGVAIPAVEAVAIACCAIAVTARLLARDRRAHAALMRSRGASVWHLARYDALEALAVTVPAFAAAPFAAAHLAAALPPSGPLRPGPTGSLWLASAVAAGVFALVLLLSGSMTARDDSVARTGRIPVGVTAAGVDLAALALAAAGIWELRTALSRQAATGAVDPLTVCAPTLAVLAFALASVRLVAVVGRIAQSFAGRGRGWSGAFGSWHAARLIRTHTAAVVLIAAATALVVISGADRAAADRSARDQADFSVGADVRGTDVAVQPLGSGGQAAMLPGVADVAQVTRVPATIGRSGTGGGATVLAADPAAWQRVAVLRSDLAPGGTAAIAAPLRAHDVAEPGLVLPGKPHSVQLNVRLTGVGGGAVSGASMNVTLAGAAGEPETLDAPLGASTAAQRVNLDLTPAIGDGSQVAWPLRVIRIGVVLATPSSGSGSATFDVQSVAADTGAATLAAGQSWSATASTNVAVVANTEYDLSKVRQAGSPAATAGGGMLLHGTFDPGTVPPSVGYPGQSSYSAGVAVPAPAAVPAVATPQFLSDAGAHVGATVDVTAGGGDVLLDIVGEATSLPTTRPDDDAVLVDQGALDAYSAAHSLATFGEGELWLGTRPGAAAQVSAKLLSAGLAGTVQDRFSTAAELIDDPVRGGPLGALTIAAWAAVLFALFGYGSHVAALLRERVPQLAAVRALGVGAGRIGVAFGVEQALVAVVGVLAGGAVGLLLSELIIPATVLARDGQTPVPSVLVSLDWTAVGWSAAAVVAVIGGAGVWAGLLAPRLRVASLLRAGDAG
jgi:hypothetical protein